MKIYLPERVYETRSDRCLPLLETIRNVLCNGDILLHVQSQDINLTLKTSCHLLDEEMHIVTCQVVEHHWDRSRVVKI